MSVLWSTRKGVIPTLTAGRMGLTRKRQWENKSYVSDLACMSKAVSFISSGDLPNFKCLMLVILRAVAFGDSGHVHLYVPRDISLVA